VYVDNIMITIVTSKFRETLELEKGNPEPIPYFEKTKKGVLEPEYKGKG
jgi:hypothetical protein